jgi:hypothetical protein
MVAEEEAPAAEEEALAVEVEVALAVLAEEGHYSTCFSAGGTSQWRKLLHSH